MAGKIRVIVKDNNYIETLGQYGPIATPMKMDFKRALHIVNEGNHDVEVETKSGASIPFDVNYVKKMIARGDEGVEKLWNEVQKESGKALKNTDEGGEEDESVEEDDSDSSVEEETPEEEAELTEEEIMDMSYTELKSEAANRDLGGSGSKEELQIKLLEDIGEEPPDELYEQALEEEVSNEGF